jgi:hypothetical protein
MSVDPPGAKGTINLMGFCGKAWALTAGDSACRHTKAKTESNLTRITSLLEKYHFERALGSWRVTFGLSMVTKIHSYAHRLTLFA